MAYRLDERFVVAVSSRALLDMAKANRLFEKHGSDFYIAYQRRRRDEVLEPGPAFPLIQRLLGLNQFLPNSPIEVVLVSRNSPSSAIRIRHTLNEHGLPIIRSWFTSGDPVAPYLKAAHVDLFLSADPDDVKAAHANGYAAALVYGKPYKSTEAAEGELRVAFDGDAVIFAEDSERIYKDKGIEEFLIHEHDNAASPMRDGPFAHVFRSIGKLKAELANSESWRVKVGLFTARNAPADARVLETMEQWGIQPDHLAFLGGVAKQETVRAFNPHIYFDDQSTHLIPVSRYVTTAQVPSGLNDISNDAYKCPECGGIMVERVSRKGVTSGRPFWGCSSFPRCNYSFSKA